LLIIAERTIEFTSSIHPKEAIITSLVEINDTRSSLYIAHMVKKGITIQRSHLIEVLWCIHVPTKRLDQLIRVIPYYFIDINELCIQVADDSLLGLKMEQDSPSSNKRLTIQPFTKIPWEQL
jgi:hypothetical protein